MLTEAIPQRYRLMVQLAAWCAPRFGELTELRRGDVDTKAGELRIRRAVVLVDGRFVVEEPKSDAGIRASEPPLARSRVNYPARKAAGRPDLRFHDLQHTGAVLAAQTGATLAELMGRLSCLHLDLRQLKLAARALDGSVT